MVISAISNEKQLQKEVQSAQNYATALEIRTTDDSISAQELLQEIKTKAKSVEQFFQDMKQKAYDSWKEIVSKEKAYLDPLAAAEKIIKGKVIAYEGIQERKRQDEARKAQAKADEEARKEQEKLEARAAKAEEKGNVEQADALREQKQLVRPEPVFTPPEPTKVQGSTFKRVWRGDVTDLALLCRSIADGKAPLGLISVNVSALNAFAKGVKNTMPVAGIRFFEDTDMSVRSK